MKPASETRVPIIAFEVQILNNQLKRLFPIDPIYDSPLGRQQDFSGGRKRPISKSIKVIRGTQNKQPPPESSIARRRESFTSIRAQRFALASGVAQFPKPEPCVRRFSDERASCPHKQKESFGTRIETNVTLEWRGEGTPGERRCVSLRRTASN